MTFPKKVIDELTKPLGREHVKTRQGIDYVESHYVIRRLNEIFGHHAWSFNVDETRCVFDGENERGKPHTAYVAHCTLTVIPVHGAMPVMKKDVGGGDQTGGDAGTRHSNAIKGAVSDAMKRCARQLGDQFGLALYSKTQENVVDAGVKTVGEGEVGELIQKATNVDDLTEIYGRLSPAQKKVHRDDFKARRSELEAA